MILAKKVRIYPTKEQEQKLWQSVGTARFIYNYTLAKKVKKIEKRLKQKQRQISRKYEINKINKVQQV